MEHDIDKMSNVSAIVVLLVSFNVNPFDYLSVKGNLNPVAKYLKVKTRGMGKYEMAVPIAKELVRKGYVVPKDPMQKLNYNPIKRDEIKSKKDISFLFVKKTQHLQVLSKVYFQLMLDIPMSLRTSMTHSVLLFRMS